MMQYICIGYIFGVINVNIVSINFVKLKEV